MKNVNIKKHMWKQYYKTQMFNMNAWFYRNKFYFFPQKFYWKIICVIFHNKFNKVFTYSKKTNFFYCNKEVRSFFKESFFPQNDNLMTSQTKKSRSEFLMIIKIFVTYCFFFKSEIMAWLVLLSNKFENVFGGSHDFIRKGELSGKFPNF